jgi:uncharacterized membrane protein YdjX (TVP38/TMEM64 family)
MKKKYYIIKIIIIFLVFFLFFRFIRFSGFSRKINIHSIVQYTSSKGRFAELVFLFIYAIKPIFVGLPSTVFSISSGILFGSVKGFIINMLGFFLSGSLAFYLSRLLGNSFVEKLLKNKTYKLEEGIEKNAFRIIFLLRLPPIFPYDIVSFAAGLTKIKYTDFILASLLGVIPETICYSFIGRNMRNPFSYKILYSLILIIIVTVGSMYIYNKKKQKT